MKVIHDQIPAAAAMVKVPATHNIFTVKNDACSEFDKRVSSASKRIVLLSSPQLTRPERVTRIYDVTS